MHLKTFSAPTISLAMARVRDVLGDQAVIVSAREASAGQDACIAAAVETGSPIGQDMEAGDGMGPHDILDEIFDYHRLPPPVADPLRATAGNFDGADAVTMLAGALDAHYRFNPLDCGAVTGSVVLVGPPGSGKTVACAKIAAAALLASRPVRIVNADTGRAGTADRLRALAGRLSLVVEDAPDEETLRSCSAYSIDELVIVDTGGTNPLDETECALLQQIIALVRGQTYLVLPSGQDAFEAAEHAAAFAALGADGMIAARLDTALRYGALLAAAMAGKLALCAAGMRPEIGDVLRPLNPMSLARLLIWRCDRAAAPFDRTGIMP